MNSRLHFTGNCRDDNQDPDGSGIESTVVYPFTVTAPLSTGPVVVFVPVSPLVSVPVDGSDVEVDDGGDADVAVEPPWMIDETAAGDTDDVVGFEVGLLGVEPPDCPELELLALRATSPSNSD